VTRDFYRQHHELDAPTIDGVAFRPFYRRRSRIDSLVADAAITPIVWRAAVVYRGLAEHATAAAWGARDDESRDRMPRMPNAAMVDRVAARYRLQVIRRRIGTFATRMIDAIVVEDLPWAELGRRLIVDPKTARAWGITALQLLPPVVFGVHR
jgi:hypothetical protein